MTLGAGMNLEEASRPLYFEEAGGIGMIAVGYRRGCKPAGEDLGGCLLWNEMDLIRERIREIKEKCRWCVVVCHGGEEFTSLPSPYVRDRYLAYLDMGADLVVCHHPHVPMNYELVGNKAIFYSLGNFIFDTDYQRAQFNTEKGILLKLVFTRDHYAFRAMGIRIDRETERIVPGPLPDIFENVPEEEYVKLSPLAAKMFLSATKRQQKYLKPAEFEDMDEEAWREHFLQPMRSGRVPGEALDFTLVYPLARKAEEGLWKESRLEKVKQYILDQI
jgi:poly-gamma-glutamate synthesis protein (capsule biosynthesis protein)